MAGCDLGVLPRDDRVILCILIALTMVHVMASIRNDGMNGGRVMHYHQSSEWNKTVLETNKLAINL